MNYTKRFAPLAAALMQICQTVDGWDVPPTNPENTHWETYWARHARGAAIETGDDLYSALWALALMVGGSPAAMLVPEMQAELATLADADIANWVEAKLALAHRATHSGGPDGRAAKMMRNACERIPTPRKRSYAQLCEDRRANDRWMGY